MTYSRAQPKPVLLPRSSDSKSSSLPLVMHFLWMLPVTQLWLALTVNIGIDFVYRLWSHHMFLRGGGLGRLGEDCVKQYLKAVKWPVR